MNLESFLIALAILLLLVELQYIIERFFELISRREVKIEIKVPTRGSANQLARDQPPYPAPTFNCQLLSSKAALLPNCCLYRRSKSCWITESRTLLYVLICYKDSLGEYSTVFVSPEVYVSHLSILYHALQRMETDETCNKISASPPLSHHARPPSLGNYPIYQMTNFSM
jgi:hypothetical protein